MLLKIELENFFSIKEKVCIDFRAGNINTAQTRKLQCNVIEWNKIKVLKSIGFFGPNASGKSNILKAINFCYSLILESHQYNEGVVFNFHPFKFDRYPDKPSSFLINFVCENVEYEYSFTLTRNRILKESLYYSPNNRRAKLFIRDETKSSNKYSFSSKVIQSVKNVVTSTSSVNLFLSRASNMNRSFAQKIYRYFLSSFPPTLPVFTDKTIKELFVQYKPQLLKALTFCDSTISDITFVPISFGTSNFDAIKFQTYHKRQSEICFDMNTEESDGTRHLFFVLLRILDIVKNKQSLMLDDFDAHLHTRLADFILNLVHASSQSQLLFSSHNTNLLDMNLLRKDQIVFVSKKDDDSTETYSLYDYKDFRENMDAEKGYKQGRFGAVPYVDSDLHTLVQLETV